LKAATVFRLIDFAGTLKYNFLKVEFQLKEPVDVPCVMLTPVTVEGTAANAVIGMKHMVTTTQSRVTIAFFIFISKNLLSVLKY
jgi:hypothetical protein